MTAGTRVESDLRIEVTPMEDGLRVSVRGTENLENTMHYWNQIAEAIRPGVAKYLLLVDELQGQPLTESQWLHLVVSMQGTGIEQLRIAHVKPLGLQQVEYCEIFARDAGIEAKVFEDEILADIWLRYGEREGS